MMIIILLMHTNCYTDRQAMYEHVNDRIASIISMLIFSKLKQTRYEEQSTKNKARAGHKQNKLERHLKHIDSN